MVTIWNFGEKKMNLLGAILISLNDIPSGCTPGPTFPGCNPVLQFSIQGVRFTVKTDKTSKYSTFHAQEIRAPYPRDFLAQKVTTRSL